MLESPIRPAMRSPLQQALDRIGSAPAVMVYPLDLVGGVAPLFAYSPQKLSSSYTGPSMNVIRPSDSANQDIGFDGNELDMAALTAFLGAEVGLGLFYDQSGNANHPTVLGNTNRFKVGVTLTNNGHPTTYFESGTVACYFNLPATVSAQRQAVSFYSVLEMIAPVSSTAIVQFGSGTDQISFYGSAAAAGRGVLNGNPTPGAATTFDIQTRPHLYAFETSASATAYSQGAETKTGAAPTDVAMTGGSIGDTSVLGAAQGYYYASAFIGYGRVLSAEEKTSIRSALASLYTIPTGIDRVVFEGDSITMGAAPAAVRYNGFARQASRLLPPTLNVYNAAKGGDTITVTLGTVYTNGVGSIIGKYADTRIVFLHIGTNDIGAGRTDAEIYAEIQTFCASVRASGGLAVVSTLLPSNAWTAPQKATREALDTNIRTNWASFADGLADFGADATMGPQAAAANPALYPDGLHPSELGHSYLAPIAAAAINAML